MRRDVGSLLNYRELAPHARRAHPSEEHFLPLLVAIGASQESDHIEIFDGGMTYDVLAMDAILFAQNSGASHGGQHGI